MSRDRRLLASLGLLLLAFAALVTWVIREGPSRLAPSPRSVEEPGPDLVTESIPALPAASNTAGEMAEEREAVTIAEPGAPAPLPFGREDIYGTVLDALTRAPLAGARVRVFLQGASREPAPTPSAEIATDAAGRFRYEGVGAFEGRDVLVLADGYAAEPARLDAGRANEVLLSRGLEIGGRVLRRSDRSPVPSVQVWLGWQSWDLRSEAAERVLTDDQGRFLLTGAPSGLAVPIPIRFGQIAAFPLSQSVSLGTESVEGLELLVGERGELRLRLVDLEGGVPLAGFRGRVENVGPFQTDGSGMMAIGHDTDRLEAIAGGVLVEIVSEATCTTRILIPPEELGELHDVPISRGSRIEGLVRDQDGLPVQAARVSIQIDDPHLSSPQATNPGLPRGVAILSPTRRLVRTDASGAFALDRLFVSGPSPRNRGPELRVSGERWEQVALSIDVPPPGGKRWIEVTLNRGSAVRGRVLRNGEPFGGAYVEAFAGVSRDGPRCTTNDGGEYFIPGLAPGATRLEARLADNPSVSRAEAAVVLTAGETLDQDLAFTEEARASIEGRVTDEQGQPVAGVLVFLRNSDLFTIGPTGTIRGLGNESTSSSEEGRFQLDVPAGSEPLEIVAWRAGGEGTASAVPGDRDVGIVVPVCGVLRLSVTDPSGERASSVGQILWWNAGSSRETPCSGFAMQLAPSADGFFEMKLPVARWDIELQPGFGAPALLTDVDVTADLPREVAVTLRRGTTVELRFEPGGPDEGAKRVTLLRAEERARMQAGDLSYMMSLARARPSAASDGALLVRGLAPGLYSLDNLPKGWAVDPGSFEVPDVERHTVTLRWVRLEERR